MRKQGAILLLLLMISLAPGCRHKPVESNYGSAYINCDQPRTEILIDDQTTHRFTPAQISGIPAGQHQIRLRHLNYTTFRQTITIRPNVINRFWFVLHALRFRTVASISISGACDAVIDPDAGVAFVASADSLGRQIHSVRIVDSTLVLQQHVDLPFAPEALAADSRSGYLCCHGRDSNNTRILCAIDRTTMGIAGQNDSVDVQGLSEISFANSGSQLVGADPAGHKLMFFNPATVRTTRTINLPIAPDHFNVSPDGRFYAASLGQSLIARIDPGTGNTIGSTVTPYAPDGIFWDIDGRTAGVWNRLAKTITLINTANWSTATGLGDIGGDLLTAVCWSIDPDYLLALMVKQEPLRVESALATVYHPEWTSYGQITDSGISYQKIFRTKDQTKLLILFTRNKGGGLQLIDVR